MTLSIAAFVLQVSVAGAQPGPTESTPPAVPAARTATDPGATKASPDPGPFLGVSTGPGYFRLRNDGINNVDLAGPAVGADGWLGGRLGSSAAAGVSLSSATGIRPSCSNCARSGDQYIDFPPPRKPSSLTWLSVGPFLMLGGTTGMRTTFTTGYARLFADLTHTKPNGVQISAAPGYAWGLARGATLGVDARPAYSYLTIGRTEIHLVVVTLTATFIAPW